MSGFDISALEEQLKIDEAALVKQDDQPIPPQEEAKEEEVKEPTQEEELKADEVDEADDEAHDKAPEEEEDEGKRNARFARERAAQKKEQERERMRALELENMRLKTLEEARKETTKQEKVEDPEPDAVLEPEAHYAWKLRQFEEREQQREKKLQELEQRYKLAEAENIWKETDAALAEKNPVYAKSIKFLRENLRQTLRQENPNATQSQIESAARQTEYQFVGKLANTGLDIDSYFIGEALKAGYNPYEQKATTPPAKPVEEKPKTDQRELAFHKRNAGSVASVPQGGGKGRISSEDLAKMSTMSDVFRLGREMSDSDWDRMAEEEAARAR